MARKRTSVRLHLLTVKQVQAAGDGDHSDGGGLLLRVRGESTSWVFRFTSPAGRRREMGLGVARRGSPQQAGDSLTGARGLAHEARALLLHEVDPIDDRDRRRDAAHEADREKKTEKARERWTPARCAREYHERVIEASRTWKHAAQWLASLENHVPAALWNKPIGDIDPPELLQALNDVKPHARARNLTEDATVRETVRRIRQRLDAVFEDANFHKRCTGNPAAAVRRKMREVPEALNDMNSFAALATLAPAQQLDVSSAAPLRLSDA
jgi:hypothetical protein